MSFPTPEKAAYFERFHTPAAQELRRLHFAQQAGAGIIATYASVLPEHLHYVLGLTSANALRRARQIMYAEFPLMIVSDADADTGEALDLSLLKIDPRTGKLIEGSHLPVVNAFDEHGAIAEVTPPWTPEQASLIQQQGTEQAAVGLDPRILYTDTMHGWTE
jgi:hypothetical protein